MRHILKSLGACALALEGQAHAATVTRDFELIASGFTSFSSEPAPFRSLTVRFGVTYDNAANGFLGASDYFTAVTDGDVNAGPFSAAPSIGYFQPGPMSPSPRLVVGGALNGANVMLNGTDDFFFSFDPTTTGTARAMLGFSSARSRSGFVATDAVVNALVAAPAVPEPATWIMMLTGFGAMGYSMRRSKRATRVLFSRASA